MRVFTGLLAAAMIGGILGASVAPGTPDAGIAEAVEDDPDGAILYRRNVMRIIGAYAQNISAVLTDDVGHTYHIQLLTRGLAEAARLAPVAFEQTATEGTRIEGKAKPAVWLDWANFVGKMKTFETEAAKLAEIGNTADLKRVGRQMREVSELCKSCHQEYKLD